MRHLGVLLLLLTLVAPAARQAQAQPGSWRDTPFVLWGAGEGDRYGSLNHTCWDPVNPGQLLVAENGIGIARYDLRSGERTLVAPAGRFNYGNCSDTGWLYWGGAEGMVGYRPGGEPTSVSPPATTYARDGSDIIYGLTGTTV